MPGWSLRSDAFPNACKGPGCGNGMEQTMRICVILNPAARGARLWSESLEREVGSVGEVQRTRKAGDARALAAAAAREGFDVVVAAGGDGTVHEVLNGLAEVPEALERVRLGVLPLGTANVLARELALPHRPGEAWQRLFAGQQRRWDLGWAQWRGTHGIERRYFAQLGGAGLDARAIERVPPNWKARLGPWAYVWAGWRAVWTARGRLEWDCGAERLEGELVLVGNGRLYGGPFVLFPEAVPDDGLLDVCVFPRVTVWRVLLCGPWLLVRGRVPERMVLRRRASQFRLTAARSVPFELDGELVGRTPAEFGVIPKGLCLVA